MGLNPLEAPVDVTIACWEWGAYLGEEGKRNGIRAKVSSWRRISPDSLIPHAKASGPVPQQRAGQDRVDEGRLRGGDPARRPRLRVRGHRREHLRRARRRDRHARPAATRSSTASPAARSSRSRATSATRSSSATSRRAELYLADEVFMTGTAAELVPVREIDDHAIGAGEPGEITRVLQARLRRRAPRPHRALPRVARRRARRATSRRAGDADAAANYRGDRLARRAAAGRCDRPPPARSRKEPR